MQSPGVYISAIGHTGLIGWLILGWGLSSDPLPFDVADVSVVSTEEYAALVAATTPQPGVADPPAPATPEIEDAPSTPEPESAAPEVSQPEQAEAPDDETPPPEPPTPPEPPADVIETTPTLAQPEAQATPDLAVSDQPQARPADRVAPVPVAPPPPEADISDLTALAQTADPLADVVSQEPEQDATAPQEAATQIVTEADEPSGAVTSSIRPSARPSRPAPQPQVAEDTSDDDALAAALADALAGADSGPAPALPAGPPLSGSEQDGFRVAVSRCWNVDTGSEAANVQVTVAFDLSRDGKVSGQVRQIASSGGSGNAVETAFQAARRAILRCGAKGFDLPAEKYDHWKAVELTFDPSSMRLR